MTKSTAQSVGHSMPNVIIKDDMNQQRTFTADHPFNGFEAADGDALRRSMGMDGHREACFLGPRRTQLVSLKIAIIRTRNLSNRSVSSLLGPITGCENVEGQILV